MEVKNVDIVIICPGKMDLQFRVIFNEYYKRCKNKVILKEFVIKENDEERRIKSESNYIISQLKSFNGKFIILLEIDGKSMSSENLANLFSKLQNDCTKSLIFIIGGSFGVNDEVKNIVNLKMSFGKNTWPHNLMKIMLMEQVFRAETILDGRDYHH